MVRVTRHITQINITQWKNKLVWTFNTK